MIRAISAASRLGEPDERLRRLYRMVEGQAVPTRLLALVDQLESAARRRQPA
jgi:hypothetical protein